MRAPPSNPRKIMAHAQGFVLLQENRFDSAAFLRTLQQEWGISPEEDGELDGDMLTFNVGENLCAVSLMPAPIPDGEAEDNAAFNYYWPEAVEITRQHQAHLLVAVMPGGEDSAVARMQLYSKIICSCLADANALGVYTSGTVFAPDFYRSVCAEMRQGQLPVPIWVFLGLYQDEGGNNAYTIGMRQFDKMEMEIRASQHDLNDIHGTLLGICAYIISQDVTLHDGETIGFSAEQQLRISRSPAIAGGAEETLKIAY